MESASRARVFLTHLLPALQKIQKRTAGYPSVSKRRRAIRLAADMCLAQTATETAGAAAASSGWSRALNLRLHRKIMKQSTLRSHIRSRRTCRTTTLVRRLKLASLTSHAHLTNLKTLGGGHGAVEKRVRTLQRLVPGGRDMGVDVLFQETADYIMNLRMQVHAMQALAEFCSTEFADRCAERDRFHDNKSAAALAQMVSHV